jgi:hypothetical protein
LEFAITLIVGFGLGYGEWSSADIAERNNGDAVLSDQGAPMPDHQNRIMIYGPKNDGTYTVEFKTAMGEALTISVPEPS